MDLKLMVLLLFLCALAITSTEGALPKCCLMTSMNFPRKLLMKVEQVEEQRNSGACEINALVLHVKKKKYCAHPKIKRILKKLQRKTGRRVRKKL
ncbi:hypothetical protein DPEC_G00256360 [Dallia pectoralis]|uniref:Uncharacterized protein n=1 Tax=Dallia pectoralis TaxID=75939 RepID=A0ACC2FQU8_DALPE|nr:hypothetical protein DPEC_G00256360 [Dallia pectoralis]